MRNSKYFIIGKALFRAKGGGFFWLGLALAVVVGIFATLVEANRLFGYWHQTVSGFTPDVVVYFPEGDTVAATDTMRRDVAGQFQLAHSKSGIVLDAPGLKAYVPGGETVENEAVVLGLRFEGDRDLRVEQAGREMTCQVIDISRFGGYRMGLAGCRIAPDGGPVTIIHDNDRIALEVAAVNRLVFDDANRTQDERIRFRRFIADFAARFIDLRFSGFSFDRFHADGSSGGEGSDAIDRFDSFEQQRVLAYLGLVFSNGKPAIALATRDLMSTVSKFDPPRQVRFENEHTRLDVVVINQFDALAERFWNGNIILMNARDLEQQAGGARTRPFLFLHLVHEGDMGKVVDYVKGRSPGAQVYSKQDMMPLLQWQARYADNATLMLLFLLFVIAAAASLALLANFYRTFEGELLLLKTYGLRLPPFSIMLTFLFGSALLVASPVYFYLHMIYNGILAEYYFPPFLFAARSFLQAAILLFPVLLAVLIFEYKYFRDLAWERSEGAL